jgi:hypothetical protein
MTLLKLKAEQALENRKLRGSGWGSRNETNRVEPVALPYFDVPFQFEPGEPIFTIGSCFARNVEAVLRERGFRVPARQMFELDEFRELNPAIMNNFGVASIANEFAWALDPQQAFDFDRNIVETGADRWVDLHIITSEKPRPRGEVVARRLAIIDVTRSVRDCRVVIMTLGLVEVWYDCEQGIYLNAAPNARVLARWPERFELHVLDFPETLAFMERSIALLRTFCRSDQQIILTVSPVPLTNTLRPDDVMVANSYSKSCLRTVAEHICLKYDNVTYFPSYESVTLTDRKIAWADDLVHVTPEIVRTNVGRMVNAFVPSIAEYDVLESAAAKGELLELENEAVKASESSRDEATIFFERFADYGRKSPRLAMSAARHYLRMGDVDRAVQQIEWLPQSEASYERSLIEGQLAYAEGRHADAVSLLAPWLRKNAKHSLQYWMTLIRGSAANGDVNAARSYMLDWCKAAPKRRLTALGTFAAAVTRSDPEAAVDAYRTVLAETIDPPWTQQIRFIEALTNAGRTAEALTELKKLKPASHSEQIAYDRMAGVLGAVAS